MKRLIFAFVLTLALVAPHAASASPIFFNGFEVNTAGWSSPTRVASGTGGVTSSSGSWHATTAGSPSGGAGDFTRWGGYNFGAGDAVPTAFQEYTTGVNIFLDVNAGYTNDARLDFDSAINDSLGMFLRDFIFNCGFYNDATGPGAGTNRFVCSTSNNSQPGSAFAKNTARDPFAISTTGWYDFQTHFYNNGGFLAADLSIFNSSSMLQHSWTLTTTDAIGAVGGNRYGWFDYNQISNLAFDNARLDTAVGTAAVPEPASLILLGTGLVGVAVGLRRKAKLAK
jgi:hypothetical protein